MHISSICQNIALQHGSRAEFSRYSTEPSRNHYPMLNRTMAISMRLSILLQIHNERRARSAVCCEMCTTDDLQYAMPARALENGARRNLRKTLLIALYSL